MKEWIPFYQSLIWPTILAGLAVWFRAGVTMCLAAIAERIRSGASFEAGPTGIKIGAVQSPPSITALATPIDTRTVDDLPHDVYITHQATRDASLDRRSVQYHRVRIWLDADEPKVLDDVKSVVYHLHPTFKDPDRTSIDRQSSFQITTAAWGEFNMTAEIFFRSDRPKLVVERYINF